MKTLPLAIVVLAAGHGKRMKSNLPKVLHKVAHRPLVMRVLDAAMPLQPEKVVAITGFEAEMVEETITTEYPKTTFVRQTEQLGTGHAVLQALPSLKGFEGTVMVLYGDAPLLTTDMLLTLFETHTADENDITLITTHVDEPGGFGRVLRADDGDYMGTIEAKDATEEQLEITEVSSCIYAFNTNVLKEFLPEVKNANKQSEYYLNSIDAMALAAGQQMGTITIDESVAVLGANSRIELAEAEVYYQDERRDEALENGVTLLDPQTVYFSWDTEIEPDVTIGPSVYFGPGVKISSGAEVKGFSHIEGTTLAAGSTVGPFARLRNGTELQENAHIGSFVETKKTIMGEGAKAGRLSYLGDGEIGAGVNIGAGTIFANYNSNTLAKNTTTVEDGASIGANNTLVAPVTVGKNAFTAGGSTIRKDVPPESLAFTDGKQKTKPGFIKPAKKGA